MTSSSAIRLRPAAPADVPAIRALTRRAYQPWVAVIGREPAPMTADYAAAVRAHRVDLAFEENDLVGLIETRAEPDHLLVINVAVAPSRQGQGLGRRLLAHAESLARDSGLAELRLYTNAAFLRNIRIYLAFGYDLERRDTTAWGVRVQFRKQLTAPGRLFLPGAGADPAFWRPLGDRLPASWPKHYFGWPGLGDQPADPAVGSLDDLVAMVEAELGAGPVDLLAQSMGGVVAMLVTLRRPETVRRLVLTATSGGVDAADRVRFDWRANYRREYPRAGRWIAEARVDLTAQLQTIGAPTLLIWGGADPISPPAVGERLAELLPDARLHVVPGAGHDLAQTHAADLAPLVGAHLGPSPR